MIIDILKLRYIIIIFGLISSLQCDNEINDPEITWLESGELHTVHKNFRELSRVFCHGGDQRTIIFSLKSIYVDIQCSSSYTLFEGSNGTDVVEQYKSHLSSWLPLLPWRQSQFAIPVFANYCIGITSETSYSISLSVRKINFWRVLQLVTGVILFLSAPSLCHNICFYYATGISVGVLASLVFLVLFLSRLMPKRSAAYSVLLFGWSMVLYVIQLLWFNIREVLLGYSSYLLVYVGLSSFLSFAFCYRYKPMTDSRSQDLMQWSVQIIGLILIFFSSEFREFSLALVIFILTIYNFPAVWTARLRTWWRCKFPPTVKLLTEEEYIRQGCAETDRGMQELRSFCQSPHCQSWKMVSRLKDPMRFARFVEGESHLTDEEILIYNTDLVSCHSFDVQVTDDESSSDSDVLLNHTPSTSRMRQMFSSATPLPQRTNGYAA